MGARDKFIVVAFVGLLALVSAYVIASGDPTRDAPPAFGGTYTEAVIGGPRALNPHFASTSVDRDVGALLFTGLTRYDQSGGVAVDLASDFRIEEDGKAWVFGIRPDARWHDGTPVTSDDVIFTVAVTQDRAYRGPYGTAFGGVRVEMVDQLTVRFLLPDIYAPFGEATTMPLLPAHLLKDVRVPDMTRHPFNQRPVGTGPFKFQGRDEQRIVLVSNPDFYRSRPYRERPYLDRIVLRFYPDSSSALQALARKEVQGYAGMLPTDAARARRLRNTAVYSMPSSEYSVLFFNLAPDRPVFLDRRVRQAIAMAINRPRLVELATEGQGAVAEQPVLPYSWAYAEDARRYEYSPAQAKAALDAAGWVDANGDGARERGQVTLRFTLLTSDDFTRVATADQIALDLAEVGIQATIEAIPFDELIEKRSRQRSYDAVLLSVASGSDPDPYPFWHSSQTKDPGTNFTGYATLAMDRALEGARRTLDQAKRRDLYAQVFAQIAEDVPAVYLYFSDFLYAVDRGLQGVRAAPITDPSQRFWNAEDWYVRTRIVE